jgi:type I restriction enzyme M protein
VERPLRLRVSLDEATRHRFRVACADANEESVAYLVDQIAEEFGEGPYLDFNELLVTIGESAENAGLKLTAKRLKLLQFNLAERDENAAPVIKKTYKPGRFAADPIRGRYQATIDGTPVIVEYEPDTEMRDTEQVPLLEDGGVEAFIRREVLPHAPDAWFEEDSIKVGYEISFTRYFYKPKPLRSLDQIRADILALERETEGLLGEIIGQT